MYINDFYLQGSDFEDCKINVTYTSKLLQSLGFILSDKSVYEPTQVLLHLGFFLDSINMKVSLGEEKRKRFYYPFMQKCDNKKSHYRQRACNVNWNISS